MDLRQRFGRSLRLAIVGGGPDSWIGRMHRSAAEMDGWFRATAGVFSGDPARSRLAGTALGFDPARSYAHVDEMLERERDRPDRIDAVAIMSPNDTHYPYARGRAGRWPRRRLREARRPRFRAGVRPCRSDTRAGPRLRDRARLLRVPDDPLRASPRARRRARRRPARAGRVHPERARDARRGRAAEQSSSLDPRPCAQRAGARDERDRLPRAAPRVLRVGAARGARRRRRPRALARPHGRRLRFRADRIRGRCTRHVHGHAGRRRRRERHPAARLRREGHARLVASRPELSHARAAGRSPRARSAAATRSCRPRSSPPGARRAATPRACARRSRTSTPKSRRSEWRARWASPFPRRATRALEDGAHTMAFIEACMASHAHGAWVDVAALPAA